MLNDNSRPFVLTSIRKYAQQIPTIADTDRADLVSVSRDDLLRSLEQMSNRMKTPNPSTD